MFFVDGVLASSHRFNYNHKIMTCRSAIFVIFSVFFAFPSGKSGFGLIGLKTNPPYVLVQYDDKNIAKNDANDLTTNYGSDLFPDHHYGVPTCAGEDESKNELVYSASGESFKILYACFPVPIDQCAMESGNFRNNYCVFNEKPRCGVEGKYEYVIKPVLDSRDRNIMCGGEDFHGEFYRVGYDFTFAEGDWADIDIYRFCYNKTTQKTLYVEYKIISSELLDSNVDDESYSKEIEISSFDKQDLGDFTKKREYFKNTKLKPRFLVPTEHMALDWWKAPLFHIVNQQLLREQFLEPMKSVDKKIRNKAKNLLGELFIRAGTFDLADYEFHSYIWWKLIYNEKRTHAIELIIHNVGSSLDPSEKLCESEQFCEEKGWGELVPTELKEFAYCCPPNYLIDAFNFESVDTLDLVKLSENEYMVEKKDCKIPIPYKPGSQNGPLGKEEKYGGFLSVMLQKSN